MNQQDSFTQEELDAIAAVTAKLREDSSIPEAAFTRGYEIIATTLICKCRVEKAVEKHKKFLKMLETFHCNDGGLPTDELIDSMDSQQWNSYRVCGQDNEGRNVMWIHGQPIPPENEATCIRASSMFFFAVHADFKTLREGVTFVIDTSERGDNIEKYGNERKMQEAWQAYPLRPKHFFIVGASMLQRVFINAVLSLIGAFAYNNKVIKRLRFATMDEVRAVVPPTSMPVQLGGDQRLSSKEYVRHRLQNFPGWKMPQSGGVKQESAELPNIAGLQIDHDDSQDTRQRVVVHL